MQNAHFSTFLCLKHLQVVPDLPTAGEDVKVLSYFGVSSSEGGDHPVYLVDVPSTNPLQSQVPTPQLGRVEVGPKNIELDNMHVFGFRHI